MTTLLDLKALDIGASDVSIWVFKTSVADGAPKFSGRWIGATEELKAALRTSVSENLDKITETIEYEVLAQNNENSALTIEQDETYAAFILNDAANETPARKIRKLKDLENSKFYVAKFVHDGRTLLAVRKTDATWSTRKKKNSLIIKYIDDELDVDNEPVFTLQPLFDFFMLEGRIFIRSKPNFESVLAYKAGHQGSFEELKAEPTFDGLFADLAPLTEYVGANKILLRRIVAIQQKGYYKDAEFMRRLRAEHQNMGLQIQFDEAGKIVPTVASGRHIFQALLDHRLESRLTALLYDVPSTEVAH